MNEPQKQQILILGGGSLVGEYLLPLLAERGYRGYVVSRKRIDGGLHFAWLSTAEVQDASWHLQDKAVIISLWPIWLLGPIMPQFLGASQLIALSSTSLFGKANSLDPAEKELVESISKAEAHVRVNCETFRIPFTVLRPTLIYDGIRDHSITFIAEIIKRFGFFMVAGDAKGLRQPIHAEDVAIAIASAINNEKSYNKSLNITGGETISYFTMIRRVSEALGRSINIIPSPKFLLKGLLHIMRALNFTDLSPSLFDRMNQDLAYDSTEAVEVLGIRPRDFYPKFPKQN
jgi:nucleoside-diphosphate-sugar epimerase